MADGFALIEQFWISCIWLYENTLAGCD